MLEELLEYVRADGRVCPMPQRWNELRELLPAHRKINNGWDPAPPLILGAWWDTPALLKIACLEEHIRFANSDGAL
jgi:hypothetical protein